MFSPIVVFLLSLGLCFTFVVSHTGNIVSICKEECTENLNQTSLVSIDLCNVSCAEAMCKSGCQLWDRAVTIPCETLCNDTVRESDGNLFCELGCEKALDIYAINITDLIGNISAPALIPETVGNRNTSVTLLYSVPFVDNVSYELQGRYSSPSLDNTWSTYETLLKPDKTAIMIDRLLPYTSYQFRIIAIITYIHVLHSATSLVITTQGYGAPSSAPVIIDLFSPLPTEIEVLWEPPLDVNAQLLAHRLSLRPYLTEDTRTIMSEVGPDEIYHRFSQLLPSTLYEFSISSVNIFGESPVSKENITTAPLVEESKTVPYLIFGAGNQLLKQSLEDIFDSPKAVHTFTNSTTRILGVALHVEEETVYFSDSSGAVWKLHLPNETSSVLYNSSANPTSLSVDWLFHKLYIVEDNQIVHCDLDTLQCDVAVDNLYSTPTDIFADPSSGFLFWSQQNEGIYRLDLADVGKDNSSQDIEQIFQSSSLNAFTIISIELRIYFINSSNQSLWSMYIDGTSLQREHENTQNPTLSSVISLTQHQGLFFWTNGYNITYEELDASLYVYHQVYLPLVGNDYVGLNIFHSDAQPTPAPPTPPLSVAVVFTENSATVKWQKPDLLQYDYGRYAYYAENLPLFQSKGVWENWLYQINMSSKYNDTSSTIQIFQSIHDTSLHLSNLPENKSYCFNVRAYSKGGYSPWTEMFCGSTLRTGGYHPLFVYSTDASLSISNLDGSDEELLVNVSQYGNNIVDISCNDNIFIIVLNTGNAVILNSTDKTLTRVRNINDAVSAVYDVIGDKLYWSAQNREISRKGLFQDRTELVYISIARKLIIDSLKGWLYWFSDGRNPSVEAVRLSGHDHVTYQEHTDWSGWNVRGLTIDYDRSQLYWMLKRDNEGALYVASLLGYGTADVGGTVHELGKFPGAIIKFPSLHYFSDRLFFIHDIKPFVGDMNFKYSAAVPVRQTVTGAIDICHPYVHGFSGGYYQENVIVKPCPLNQTTILADNDDWQNFDVTWLSDECVNYGSVYYDVMLTYSGEKIEFTTIATHINVKEMDPYTPFTLTIKPFTHWSAAEESTVNLHSPMAVPSEPRNLQVYISHHSNIITGDFDITADIRWQPPEHPNGVLLGYVLYHRFESGGVVINERHITPTANKTRHIMEDIKPYAIYSFQIAACNVKGCENRSIPVKVDTEANNPPPTLLISDKSAIRLFDVDMGQSSDLLIRASAGLMAYLAQDNTFYWWDRNSALMMFDRTAGVESQIWKQNITASNLELDWVARVLYWVEEKDGVFLVRNFSLEKKGQPQTIFYGNEAIRHLAVCPLEGMIYWTQKPEGSIKLMKISLKTRESKTVLFTQASSRTRRVVDNCNCSHHTWRPEFTLDTTNSSTMNIYVVDANTLDIFVTDYDGCYCKKLMDSSADDHSNLQPPSKLEVDHMYIYWFNLSQHMIYAIDKLSGELVRTEKINDINNIIAYGPIMQPMPDLSCMIPERYNFVPQLVHSTDVSIRLNFDPAAPPSKCGDITQPDLMYTIYYGTLDQIPLGNVNGASGTASCQGVATCQNQTSTDTEMTILGLEPYTTYIFQVSVSNYYSQKLPAALGPSATFKTKAGVPTAPRNVRAEARLPSMINLEWQLPAKPHGKSQDITYVVETKTRLADGSLVQNLRPRSRGKSELFGTVFMEIGNLLSAQTYSFKVRAYDKSGMYYSTSEEVNATTYQLPGPITLVRASRNSLKIGWISPSDSGVLRHIFEYKKVSDSDWMPAINLRTSGTNKSHEELVQSLEPNTNYVFRIGLLFRPLGYHFLWPVNNSDTRFTFKTLSDFPGQPPVPKIRHLSANEYDIHWSRPYDGGSQVIMYVLESKSVNSNWTQVYNGTAMSWRVHDLTPGEVYYFRVAAENAMGWGPYSENSTAVTIPVMAGTVNTLSAALGSAFAGLVVLIILTIIVMYCVIMKKRRDKFHKLAFANHVGGILTPDVELATLRELPHISLHGNALYNCILSTPTDADIAKLPHFARECITLSKFLGSGAFGEVFEGVAKNILCESSGDTRVAVKTLRKGASSNEKEEFLKEALLMSNFKHEHILSLLGVCLDNDPNFIILELMEDADLLSFLRNSRPTMGTQSNLNLHDLISMCADVAKGCTYLETMHFVHRDIAARNCLVSTIDGTRIVKIGDFGLARDIYKNDYYRKEGEGLLPVRWMSPESLVDGVFTSQSDVWAYGILCWEVITLGQQPYPARTNLEVLQFVRRGGRLDRPDNCPNDLHNLMLHCWAFEAADRPPFAEVLEKMEEFKSRCESSDPGDFNTSVFGWSREGGIDNLGFDEQEGSHGIIEPQEPDKISITLTPTSRKKGTVGMSPTGRKKRGLHELLTDKQSNESIGHSSDLWSRTSTPGSDGSPRGNGYCVTGIHNATSDASRENLDSQNDKTKISNSSLDNIDSLGAAAPKNKSLKEKDGGYLEPTCCKSGKDCEPEQSNLCSSVGPNVSGSDNAQDSVASNSKRKKSLKKRLFPKRDSSKEKNRTKNQINYAKLNIQNSDVTLTGNANFGNKKDSPTRDAQQEQKINYATLAGIHATSNNSIDTDNGDILSQEDKNPSHSDIINTPDAQPGRNGSETTDLPNSNNLRDTEQESKLSLDTNRNNFKNGNVLNGTNTFNGKTFGSKSQVTEGYINLPEPTSSNA